ncbi:MAG TPA: PaaI family thioesterase [Acidimicrobiales bacterium]|nr:PaaI family thioesterase [Acidimicrobiales bacterium]
MDQLVSGSWVEALGLVLTEVSGELVRGYVELDQRHHTPFGVVHGGVYALIVETVGSVGAVAAVSDRGQYAVGVNNSTDFLRPVERGRLDVVARPLQQGRTQQLWSVELTRAVDGKPAALGRLRLQNVSRPG